MAEIVGAPPCLRICEDCPSKNAGQALSIKPGEARVILNEFSIDGIYIPSHGRSTETFRKHATDLYLQEYEVFDLFAQCDGPEDGGFLERVGIATVDCPALEKMIGGSPRQGDIVNHYAQKLG